MASNAYHEPVDQLSPQTRDAHRALASLMEELEAIDWYQQRLDAASDAELKEILAHNRNEEMEHAAMTLEWLRRRMPEFDERLRRYLFTSAAITGIEEGEGGGTPASAGSDGASRGLGIGRFRKG